MELEESCEVDLASQVVASHQPMAVEPLYDESMVRQIQACAEFLDTLTDEVVEYGWSLLLDVKIDVLLSKFKKNGPQLQKLFDSIIELISRYYVPVSDLARKLCEEEQVPFDRFRKTDNKKIVAFRNKYSGFLKDDKYVASDIPNDAFVQLNLLLKCFCAGVHIQCGPPKPPAVEDAMKSANHVVLFHPFQHDVRRLFRFFKFDVNENYLRSLHTEEVANYIGKDKDPIIKIREGYVAVACKLVDSRGQNNQKSYFKVLDIIEPSKSILEVHFNRYLRDTFPTMFKNCSPTLFVNLSESQSATTLACLKSDRYDDTDKTFISFANLAQINLTIGRNNAITPNLRLWSNVKFGYL